MGEGKSFREALKKAKRIVVKVGTSTITYANGKRNFSQIDRLARELSDLQNQGKEMILVSSGAVAVGVDRLGLPAKPATIPGKQACAAVGQGVLMHTYEKLFADYGQIVAQVLITRTEAIDRHRYTNCRNTFMTLLQQGVIPIVNENDVVALDELKIGDNDNMSALVAGIVDADLVIILSDIDGVYTANPQTHPEAKLLDEIKEITPEVEALAGGSGSNLGTGGMMTKIEAAKIAVNSGVTMFIAPGDRDGVITSIMAGDTLGTVFPPKEEHLKARKGWLAFGKRIAGVLTVDAGCAKALQAGSSLLAVGIVATEGDYQAGGTVRVLTMDNREIARGIINYDSRDVQAVMGRKTSELADLIQGEFHEEIIHRDNMVSMI